MYLHGEHIEDSHLQFAIKQLGWWLGVVGGQAISIQLHACPMAGLAKEKVQGLELLDHHFASTNLDRAVVLTVDGGDSSALEACWEAADGARLTALMQDTADLLSRGLLHCDDVVSLCL